ncbi:LacI family DNA-binding transcriptional regulator [Polycladidibacter stylochi]|uniref:LacI family DNA-binding transcriptional regulator n=1 Tax=Polycladidibacter stylochi TaxID=1807766 RepID=UPI00082ABE4D|nr:LacI family DNA-binding transcriptional regulator [Pseudovibrio stylochi]
MRKSKITVSDIARKAGVSVATVSNALNDTGRMSDATKLRVKQAMDELGFVRDYGAAKLRSGRSRLVGVLVQDMANPLYAEMSAALEVELSKHGYLPILANIGEEPERMVAMINESIAHGVAGIIVSPTANATPEHFKTITKRELPCITIVRQVHGLEADFIGRDDHHGSYLVGKHFLDQGHRQFAMLSGLPGTTTAQLRAQGFYAALAEAGIAKENVLEISCPPTRDDALKTSKELAKHGVNFTALFCHNDIMAFGALSGLRDCGVDVTKDVAVAGFDNLALSSMWTPSLTTVELNPVAMGQEVSSLLIARLNGDTQDFVASRTRPSLIPRESTIAINLKN